MVTYMNGQREVSHSNTGWLVIYSTAMVNVFHVELPRGDMQQTANVIVTSSQDISRPGKPPQKDMKYLLRLLDKLSNIGSSQAHYNELEVN